MEQPAYQPNFKFKAADKELEFDEFLRGAIKDVESEKKVRELYEKAHGIDFVKQQRDKFRNDFQTYKGQWDPVEQDLKKLGMFIKNKDYLTAASALGIPEEGLIQAVKDRLDYFQLPPEQRGKLDAQSAERNRLYQLELENQDLRTQSTQATLQALDYQIHQTLQSPEVQAFAQTFEKRTGKQGSFAERLMQHGDYLYKTTGKFVPPEAVAKDLMQFVGYQPESQPQTQQQTQVMQSTEGKPVVVSQEKEKPVIKNIQAGSKSVVKKSYKTLDELREKYKQSVQP